MFLRDQKQGEQKQDIGPQKIMPVIDAVGAKRPGAAEHKRKNIVFFKALPERAVGEIYMHGRAAQADLDHEDDRGKADQVCVRRKERPQKSKGIGPAVE